MALSFQFASPRDVLAKAQRDLTKLEAAVTAQDRAQIGDALYDFAVSITSLKDWTKEHPSASFTHQEVEDLVKKSVALSSCRDIANASKHRRITKYQPTTQDVATSASPQVDLANWLPVVKSSDPAPPFKLKVVRADGSRLEVVALAREALREWTSFLTAHGL